MKSHAITDYLQFMIKQEASDLFFSPSSPVMAKIHGKLKPINEEFRLPHHIVKEFAYELMTDYHIKRFEENWVVNMGVSIDGLGRFRVNVMRQRGHVAIVVRSVKTEPPTIQQLHLPEFLGALSMEKRGLVLVAGATGSGKSSTLAAMIDHRNTNEHSHILTVEDPIEFLHSYKKSIINQREVGTDTKSYADALKEAMREAPNVILIGEIRDVETMRSAINYSETGHLCLATIHASNAVETLDRIINFFPQNEHKQLLIDLSHNLKAVVCQRLIPAIDSKLRPALEILTNSPYINELILEGRIDKIREAFERNLEKEMCTFDSSLLELYLKGEISKDEALANADSKHNLAVQIRLKDSGTSVNSDEMQDIHIEEG